MPLSQEKLDTLQFPVPDPTKRASAPDYYPFRAVSWDEGKSCLRDLELLPKWTEDFTNSWFFRGVEDDQEAGTLTASFGYKGSGKIIIRAKPDVGSLSTVSQAFSQFLHFSGVSHQQKQATCQLALYKWFELVSIVEPEKMKL